MQEPSLSQEEFHRRNLSILSGTDRYAADDGSVRMILRQPEPIGALKREAQCGVIIGYNQHVCDWKAWKKINEMRLADYNKRYYAPQNIQYKEPTRSEKIHLMKCRFMLLLGLFLQRTFGYGVYHGYN